MLSVHAVMNWVFCKLVVGRGIASHDSTFFGILIFLKKKEETKKKRKELCARIVRVRTIMNLTAEQQHVVDRALEGKNVKCIHFDRETSKEDIMRRFCCEPPSPPPPPAPERRRSSRRAKRARME